MTPLRLTRRGVALLVAAPALYGGGVLLGQPVLRALAGFVLGAVVVALVPSLRKLTPTVTRTVRPQRLERGERAVASLVVRNDTVQRQRAFVALDRVQDRVVDVPVVALAPGEVARHSYGIPTDRRGRLQVGPLSVERSDLLGLARSRTGIGLAVPLWVHPRRHPVRLAGGGRLRHHHEGAAADLPVRGSTDLRALREYVPGDELRHVHWKASARASRLLVREYVDPVQPVCVVVLDNRTASLDATAFEEAVEVAASVAWAAVSAEHRTTVWSAEGVIASESASPEAGGPVLDALSAVQQREDVDLAAVLDRIGQSARDGWLVLVTGAADPAVLPRLVGLRSGFRSITLFDLSGWPDAAPTPGVVPVRATTARAAIESWNAVVG